MNQNTQGILMSLMRRQVMKKAFYYLRKGPNTKRAAH